MFLVIVTLYLALGVALGALGVHFLEPRLSEAALSAFHTAIDYHQLYALFCFMMIILSKTKGGLSKTFKTIMPMGLIKLFFLALSVFSGSIYIYVFTGQKFWVKFTPVGGFLLIISWMVCACLAFKMSFNKAKRLHHNNDDELLNGD